MRLRLSSRAHSDIAAIVEFGVETVGPDRTTIYVDRIEHAFRRLLDHPLIGRREGDLHRRARSLSCGSHRIFCSVEDDEIVVRRILHKAADGQQWSAGA